MSTQINSTAATLLPQVASHEMVGYKHGWLMDVRDDAKQLFEKVGLPNVKDEQWRYTNLRAIKAQSFGFSKAGEESLVKLSASANPRLVLVNGFYREDLSSLHGLAEGVTLNALSSVLSSDDGAELEGLYGSTLPKAEEQHGFTALNSAYAQDGFVLRIADKAIQETPLEICFVSTASLGEHKAHHYRNLIISGVSSQCTVIERHIGDDESLYLNNSITELQVSENAHLDHYKLQLESDQAFHLGGVFCKQAANAQVKNHTVSLSGQVIRNDLICDLLGKGAHVEMNGLVIGKDRQHIDNHTQVNHLVANCTSDEYYKTILDDQSRSVFRGRIIVAQDAQQTSADQQNNNLLLSKSAEADTKPQLEIYADDVQCSHGATVGQLDPKSMFYLNSRGIDNNSARALLTFAFANEVIQRVKVDAVRNELSEYIAGELLHGLEGLV